MSFFILQEQDSSATPSLITFAYSQESMIVNRPNRWRTWGEIVRLGKLNLWLILLVNIGLFCSVTGILVWGIGDVIRLHGFRNNGQLIIQFLLLLLPLRLLLPNTVKLFLFLVGRGYQMIK